MIQTIRLVPEDGEVELELVGEIAGILGLTPASPDDIASTPAIALRYSGRERVHDADEAIARIVAKRLVEHWERSGFVVMKKPPDEARFGCWVKRFERWVKAFTMKALAVWGISTDCNRSKRTLTRCKLLRPANYP